MSSGAANSDTSAAHETARRAELQAAVAAVGLSIRDDSKLAQSYIGGMLEPAADWPLERVVLELCSTHYLYNYTEYSELCKAVHKSILSATQDSQLASWLMQRYISAKIKIKVLSEDPMPADGTWPWLARAEEQSSEGAPAEGAVAADGAE